MSEVEFDVTFFVPCLNEENNILNTLNTLLEAVTEVELKFEILIYDDASTDGTVAKVNEFCNSHPDVTIVLKKNATNLGLGRNYIEGSYVGRGRYYMLINGDNSEPKKSIVSIIRELGKADMVIPYFGDADSRNWWRRWISILFNSLVNFFSGNDIRYYNGPVLHLRKNVQRWHPDTHGFAYQAEIITRVLDEGATYVEIPINNSDREWGASKAFSVYNICSVGHSLLQIILRRVRKEIFYRK
jgi:glycosyltransferase involved in cell wall biosynthesis